MMHIKKRTGPLVKIFTGAAVVGLFGGFWAYGFEEAKRDHSLRDIFRDTQNTLPIRSMFLASDGYSQGQIQTAAATGAYSFGTAILLLPLTGFVRNRLRRASGPTPKDDETVPANPALN